MKMKTVLIYGAWMYLLIFTAAVISGSLAREFSAGYMEATFALYFPELSPESLGRLVTAVRKGIHILGYCGLGISGYLIFWDAAWFQRSPYAGGLILGTVVAVVDELLQVWSPFRTGSVADVFLDVFGLLIGLAGVRLIEALFLPIGDDLEKVRDD